MTRVLDHAHELERRDQELAEQIRRLTALALRTNAVRQRAEEIRAFFVGLPAAGERLAAARQEAERAVTETGAMLEAAAARRAEAEARGGDESERRDEELARRRHDDARMQLERAARRRAELDERAESLRSESLALEDEAEGIGAELREFPRVSAFDAPRSLDAIPEWGARVEAALLVARSGLETERERVVREANELAASVLGESAGATLAITQVLERLERAGAGR